MLFQRYLLLGPICSNLQWAKQKSTKATS